MVSWTMNWNCHFGALTKPSRSQGTGSMAGWPIRWNPLQWFPPTCTLSLSKGKEFPWQRTGEIRSDWITMKWLPRWEIIITTTLAALSSTLKCGIGRRIPNMNTTRPSIFENGGDYTWTTQEERWCGMNLMKIFNWIQEIQQFQSFLWATTISKETISAAVTNPM